MPFSSGSGDCVMIAPLGSVFSPRMAPVSVGAVGVAPGAPATGMPPRAGSSWGSRLPSGALFATSGPSAPGGAGRALAPVFSAACWLQPAMSLSVGSAAPTAVAAGSSAAIAMTVTRIRPRVIVSNSSPGRRGLERDNDVQSRGQPHSVACRSLRGSALISIPEGGRTMGKSQGRSRERSVRRSLGVITDRDIVIRAVAREADPASTAVGDCLPIHAIVAHPDWTADRAMQTMAQAQIGRLPVLDDNERLVGVVTLSSMAFRAPDKEEALETAQ